MFNRVLSEGNINIENDFISKSFLDRENKIVFPEFEDINSMEFVKIRGLSDFWKYKYTMSVETLMGDILNALNKYNIDIAFGILGSKEGIEVYYGTNREQIDLLKTSLTASYPFIDIEWDKDFYNKLNNKGNNVGIVTGIPTLKKINNNDVSQIEKLCKGMLGESWAYLVVAKGMSNIQSNLTYRRILGFLGDINKSMKESISGGNLGNKVIESINFNSERYFKGMKNLELMFSQGMARGLWRSNSYFIADGYNVYHKLKNLIKGVYSGEDSFPEPIRTIDLDMDNIFIDGLKFIKDDMPNIEDHPLGAWLEDNNFQCDCYKYKYQNILSSDVLAIYFQLPREEFPGYYINNFVEFEVADRMHKGEFVIGNITNGNDVLQNKYKFNIKDFSRHGLIIGITGGGKTNTSKSILRTLWRENNIPFLVIESAKREYWELKNINGFEELSLFTLGAETNDSIPYRINPFEVIGNVSLQTHIDYLLSTFKASFELYPPMPYVLEDSVYEIYKDRGWDVLTGENIYCRSDYPTLDDLYYKIEVVTDRLNYGKEIQLNVKASLQARINSLRIGGKGAMLNTYKSISVEKLLKRPTIIELEDLGDDDIKAFVIGILLVQIYEYRKSLVDGKKDFEHLIVIEEAHRLLKNVSEGEGTRAKAVEFFCNMLAEIRSFGQGILIADQIPTKLAPDTLKNTNLKIIHRTVMEEDRLAVGKAMNMTDEQIQYLSSLSRGFAAVYSEGDNRPKLVKLPLVEEDYRYKRREVLDSIRSKLECLSNNFSKRNEKHQGCAYCVDKCNCGGFIEGIKSVNGQVLYKSHVRQLNERLNSNEIEKFINKLERKYKYKANNNEKICYVGNLLSYTNLTIARQKEKIVEYISYANKMHGGNY
ncbi:ATP-binding protein [Clostridium rectalis]|uniref:ATP-binding protein n=1 Tax=Clostridium rectalis TaxID=2040295 RepID=UPI000F62E794|nr:DUF87 domain-containing protein [Clostridium rectalis]